MEYYKSVYEVVQGAREYLKDLYDFEPTLIELVDLREIATVCLEAHLHGEKRIRSIRRKLGRTQEYNDRVDTIRIDPVIEAVDQFLVKNYDTDIEKLGRTFCITSGLLFPTDETSRREMNNL